MCVHAQDQQFISHHFILQYILMHLVQKEIMCSSKMFQPKSRWGLLRSEKLSRFLSTSIEDIIHKNLTPKKPISHSVVDKLLCFPVVLLTQPLEFATCTLYSISSLKKWVDGHHRPRNTPMKPRSADLLLRFLEVHFHEARRGKQLLPLITIDVNFSPRSSGRLVELICVHVERFVLFIVPVQCQRWTI